MITNRGELIKADIRVWAAGVKGPDMLGALGLETTRSNQLVVKPSLQTSRDSQSSPSATAPGLFPGRYRPVPPRAQAAHQMAATAFHNISALIKGRR